MTEIEPVIPCRSFLGYFFSQDFEKVQCLWEAPEWEKVGANCVWIWVTSFRFTW